MTPTNCRLCWSDLLTCLGAIPQSDFFAGRVLSAPLPSSSLWRCDACGSMFRHPVLSTSDYSALYAAGASDVWTAGGARNDLEAIRSLIEQRDGEPSVLDVGCNAGGFLLSLPASVKKSGVEPSTAAAEAAREAGIRVAGRAIEDLPSGELFDFIAIVDVIEHVAEPMDLMDQALMHLAPGGSLIVATGDPLNLWWRSVFRARFWYACFPEHITFPSLPAFSIWGRRHGLDPPVATRIRYRVLSVWRAVAYLVQMGVFWLSPRTLNCVGRAIEWIRGAVPPRRRFFTPGAPGVFTDHQIIVFRRG